MNTMTVGTVVRATFRGEWQGIVLAENDVRAWQGTFAFPTDTPEQEKVNKHVEWIHKEIKPLYPNERATVPVEWEFGKVYWEHVDCLIPVA